MYENICSHIKRRLSLFKFFDEVYLFGSSINEDIYSNDIDLLLVYSVDKEIIVTEVENILSVLYKCFQKPIDITVLSDDELRDCCFLQKIEKYIQIK